ncbi:hypothetical protein AVEN_150796-1 [Araneus ventricosus]|uniref:H15 domain-containing protein n=1 Tax=Araneus ventricosus TaxID=182803 RepID=A0A4Y2R0P9_ARAVE|nr:hypothetical protein AVEN_150796-1 [Araneus ventricosus]
MKNAATVKDEKSKQDAEKNKIRRWILKSVSKTTPEKTVTLYAIKKFLDSKQSGLSNNPETKLVINRLTESGHLVKIDGKFADGKNSPKDKQPPAQKRKSGNESKNNAKDSATLDKRSPTEKAKPQESRHVAKTVGKNSPKDKQPPAQKRKSGSELKNIAKGIATPSAERSSSKEAVPKESEAVN